MKKFLLDMFGDRSDINPKVVVGVSAFCIMVLYGFADIAMAVFGKNFHVEPIVFQGILATTFGALGIAGLEAIFGNKNIDKPKDSTEQKTE